MSNVAFRFLSKISPSIILPCLGQEQEITLGVALIDPSSRPAPYPSKRDIPVLLSPLLERYRFPGIHQ